MLIRFKTLETLYFQSKPILIEYKLYQTVKNGNISKERKRKIRTTQPDS